MRGMSASAPLPSRTDRWRRSHVGLRGGDGTPMRYLNALYVTEHRARVSRSKGALIVSTDGARRRVPLEAIDSVTLMGGAQMTTDAIAACAERSIRVTCMRRSGAIRFIVSGPQGGNVHLRVAQHRA